MRLTMGRIRSSNILFMSLMNILSLLPSFPEYQRIDSNEISDCFEIYSPRSPLPIAAYICMRLARMLLGYTGPHASENDQTIQERNVRGTSGNVFRTFGRCHLVITHEMSSRHPGSLVVYEYGMHHIYTSFPTSWNIWYLIEI
ncbi:hypothetical protein C8R45DRAFT_80744 [Mycena sanguinolenta]|nr:hypothetical protein C8R45DRAFT_80744 [Mycena sanguinolenta]